MNAVLTGMKSKYLVGIKAIRGAASCNTNYHISLEAVDKDFLLRQVLSICYALDI